MKRGPKPGLTGPCEECNVKHATKWREFGDWVLCAKCHLKLTREDDAKEAAAKEEADEAKEEADKAARMAQEVNRRVADTIASLLPRASRSGQEVSVQKALKGLEAWAEERAAAATAAGKVEAALKKAKKKLLDKVKALKLEVAQERAATHGAETNLKEAEVEIARLEERQRKDEEDRLSPEPEVASDDAPEPDEGSPYDPRKTTQRHRRSGVRKAKAKVPIPIATVKRAVALMVQVGLAKHNSRGPPLRPTCRKRRRLCTPPVQRAGPFARRFLCTLRAGLFARRSLVALLSLRATPFALSCAPLSCHATPFARRSLGAPPAEAERKGTGAQRDNRPARREWRTKGAAQRDRRAKGAE
jgi:hypothetical protein